MSLRFRSALIRSIVVGASLAVPMISLGDLNDSGQPSATDASPTTRPSRYGGNGGPGNAPGNAMGGGALFGDGRQRLGSGGRQFSPEEIAAAVDFFTKNSPQRMKYFNSLPPDSRIRRFETTVLVQLYRPLQNFKDSNPDLYELLVKQVALRDQAFELAKDGNDAELRTKANEIVDITNKAKAIRLDLLQKELDAQKSNLAADKANPDAAAEKEVSRTKTLVERLIYKEGRQGMRGTSMLYFDPSMDPLAVISPLILDPIDSKTGPDYLDEENETGL